MEKELKDLKSVLRSIVVSSPAQVDVRSLQRDYKNMMGVPIPLAKYGYKDVLTFLKERCSDCFLFHGLPSNPVLTLIVPESLKHIDQFVQKQKPSTVTKMKGKRRSVHETNVKTPDKPSLICETFNRRHISTQISNNNQPDIKSPEIKKHQPNTNYNNHNNKMYNSTNELTDNIKSTSNLKSDYEHINSHPKNTNTQNSNTQNSQHKNSHTHEEENESNGNVRSFLKKRLPMYDSSQYLDSEECNEPNMASSKWDNDSGRQTSSSQSSTKRAQLEELKCEIYEVIRDHEDGVLCTDLVRLYRERYGRELNFNRFGHNNVSSLLCAMEDRVSFYAAAEGVRVRDAARQPRPAPAAPRPRPLARPPSARALPVDPDDALPGIDFDPDVFPTDCMHFMESIPAQSLHDVRAGAMLEVAIGEVYSPSHFWLQRLGPQHNVALDELMDEMSAYYSSGAGRDRVLARGAVRPGHYCSSVYDRDWHRSLIIKIVDADTVKVRHVDYGTVDSVAVGSLKPLLRRWAALPAQAVRARLAGLRPGAAGRRWPHAAAAHFLHLVRDRHFVANVVAVLPEEDTVETFLIDTRGADDVCVSAEMIRAGHADARADSALRTGECYLYPRFEVLESGDTPNFAEIHRYLADGINLEYVEAYRRHVPSVLLVRPEAPAAPVAPPPALLPPPLKLLNRIPLLRRDSPPPPGSSPRAPSAHASPAPVSPAPTSPLPRDPTPPAAEPVPFAAVPVPPATEPVNPASVPTAPATVPPPPTSAPPPLQWRGPTAPALYPRPPLGGAPWGEVRLSLQECEMYSVLRSMDPEAAHWYMLSALRRATAAAPRPLNPLAPEFRAAAPPRYVCTPPGMAAPRFAPPCSYMRSPPPPPGF